MFKCTSGVDNINKKKDHVNSLKRYKRVEKVGKETSQFKVDMENGGGKSQLKIELPASFPEEPPKMSVNPDEFNNHPLVNPQTGEVRYEKIGVNWTQEPVLLVNVVKRVVDEFERTYPGLQRDLRKESQQSGLLSMSQQDDLKDQESFKKTKHMTSPKDRLRWRLIDGKATDVVLVVEKAPLMNGTQDANKLIVQNANGDYLVLTNNIDALPVQSTKKSQAEFELLLNCCVQLLNSQALVRNQLVAYNRDSIEEDETNVEYSTINSLCVKNNAVLASLNNGSCCETNKLTVVSQNLANLLNSIKQNDTKQISQLQTLLNKSEKNTRELQQQLQETKQNLEETLTKLKTCQNELTQAKQDLVNQHQESCRLAADNSKFQNEICHMTTLKNMLIDELEKAKLQSAKLQEELQASEGESVNIELQLSFTNDGLDTGEDTSITDKDLKETKQSDTLLLNDVHFVKYEAPSPITAMNTMDTANDEPQHKVICNNNRQNFFRKTIPYKREDVFMAKYKQLFLSRFAHYVSFSVLMLSYEFVRTYWSNELHTLQTYLGEQTILDNTGQGSDDKSTQLSPSTNSKCKRLNLWNWLSLRMPGTPYPLMFTNSPLVIESIAPRMKICGDHSQHERKHAHVIVVWSSLMICEPSVLLSLPIHVCCTNLVPVCLVNIPMDNEDNVFN